MVSSISKNPKGNVACPALGCEISTQQCAEERISVVPCTLNCPRNPFNPNAIEQFDRVVARGLQIGMKWIESVVSASEMAKSLKSIDRRFNPEADLALVTFENAWHMLDQSRLGLAYPYLWEKFKGEEGKQLRNEARVYIEKLASSRALLLRVLDTSKDVPYYRVQDLVEPDTEYLYVDFGVQDPLKEGEVLFGRFLTHENCLYVLPGIFVGSQTLGISVAAEVLEYLKVEASEGNEAMQQSLPEVWELLEEIQFEIDELEGNVPDDSELDNLSPDNLFRVRVELPMERSLVLDRLRRCEILLEEKRAELEVSLVDETVFNIVVDPPSPPKDEEEFDELLDSDVEPLTIGSVVVGEELLTISGENPVELELVRALVVALLQQG